MTQDEEHDKNRGQKYLLSNLHESCSLLRSGIFPGNNFYVDAVVSCDTCASVLEANDQLFQIRQSSIKYLLNTFANTMPQLF